MPRLMPRTIRGQLILGTTLLQCILVTAVAAYLYRQQSTALRNRTAQRLTYQIHLLGSAAALEIRERRMPALQSVLENMLLSPTIRAARITDLSGNTLAYSARNSAAPVAPLSATEREQIRRFYTTSIFDNGHFGLEAMEVIHVDNVPVALAWIYPDAAEDQVDLTSLLHSALIFALLAIAANALLSLLMARSVTRPLRGLLRGTKLLIRDPERTGVFPLKTRSLNEAGELTRSFNTMVSALNEQRSGLNDTLALLDSMLANAPIGFAFFDRKLRFVRMNQFLAEMDNLSISRHLGRPVQEIFSASMANQITAAIEQVFTTGGPVRELELHGELPARPGTPRTWLTSFYPVRTGGDGPEDQRPPGEQVRWVGAVIVDATERKLSEEMLRRTEKLAATGRLAASIAHEINNPLEAVTNLLYLLHQQPLDPEALQYTDMAQQEVARVSQITQQTLRFYRQSSKPVQLNPDELLDSVLALHQGRIYSNRIEVIRRYRQGAEMIAFSGEMRQIFANLIGNALDAMSKGGRMVLSVRASRSWQKPEVRGVRIVVADTGSGMTRAVRERIFDAFFTTKETTGTGLGLWVTSEIIEKHNGTVRVRSRAAAAVASAPTDAEPTSGTVFMLFFPLEGPASHAWVDQGQGDSLSPDESNQTQVSS